MVFFWRAASLPSMDWKKALRNRWRAFVLWLLHTLDAQNSHAEWSKWTLIIKRFFRPTGFVFHVPKSAAPGLATSTVSITPSHVATLTKAADIRSEECVYACVVK